MTLQVSLLEGTRVVGSVSSTNCGTTMSVTTKMRLTMLSAVVHLTNLKKEATAEPNRDSMSRRKLRLLDDNEFASDRRYNTFCN